MKMRWIRREHHGASQAAESERVAQQRLYGERRNIRRLDEEPSLTGENAQPPTERALLPPASPQLIIRSG